MDLFIIFRLSAQNHSFSSLQKHLPDTGTHNVSSMMPKSALKMSGAARMANPVKAGDPRCIMEHGTMSVQIYITRPQLYPNAVRPGKRITKLGSNCQTLNSVSALPISHLKCQIHTLVHCLAVNSFETWPPCRNRKHLPTRSTSFRWTWCPW